MTWARRFRVREYVKGSLWVLPLVGAAVGALLAEALAGAEASGRWDYSATTATTFLSTIVGAMAALTGFVITVTVLVVQTAIGTFSARYLRLWYRDRMLKATLALLVGTLTFSFGLLRRIEEESVPSVGVTLAGSLVVLSLLLFLLFLDRFLHRLRPVAVAALAAEAGKQAIDEAVSTVAAPEVYLEPSGTGSQTLVVRAERAGSIQAIDVRSLVRWARQHDSEVVLRHPVGDFVSKGATLIQVYGSGAETHGDERALRALIVIGDERTTEQDPAFAVRVMVDVAIRALSPAVNDPTTAVQVIDYLGETLRQIGTAGVAVTTQVNPAPGGAGVVIRHRRWDDFLALGVTEIREYGARSIQVVRRLRAMLEELHDSVPPECHSAVEQELARLDATVAAHWSDSIDLDLARAAGPQGIGGPSSSGRGPAE